MKPKSDSNKYTLWRNIRTSMLVYWRLDKIYLSTYLLLAAIQIASSLLSVFFTSRIIGGLAAAISNQAYSSTRIYEWLGALGLSILVERLAWRWLDFLEHKAWIKFYTKVTLDFNAAVSRLDMPQHHDSELQKRLIKVQQGYQFRPVNFAHDVLHLVHATGRMISVLIIIITFAPLLFFVMLVSLIPEFFVEKRLSTLVWGIWAEKGDRNRLAWRTSNYLQDKDRLQETKVFGLRKFLLKKLDSLYSSFYSEQLKSLNSVQLPVLGTISLNTLTLVIINLWLIQKVLNHSLTLASFSFYTGIVSQLGSSLSIIVNSFSALYDNNQYMRDFYKLIDTEPVLPRAASPTKIATKDIPIIEFRNVTFKYPGSKDGVLKNISFTLNIGDKIAFVGENGAGKTTIIKLLLRFYDVSEGQILVNGVDIKELDLESYYYHICVLFQNFSSYPYSVRDNIALGRVEEFRNDKKVRQASRQAAADKFIEKYPLKYEQVLEIGFEKGIEPSGGQWQRLALARALFRDAGILILDEPTAAVDAKSEYAIFKTLEEHSEKRTTVIVSHRFSTVRMAHKIFVIENGEITEHGTHYELMRIKNGLYKEMFEKQAEGYR